MAKITVDGAELEVPDNSMLLPVLLDRGLQIPHYCYHPKLSIDGSCRMCLVKVEGLPKLTISCNTPVRDGMVVDTRGPEVTKARQGVLELLLVNHPLDCPICDQAGECYLQDYAFEYGRREARTQEPRRKLLKRVDVGPRVVLDQERCILCRRCVRFCKEITETRELGVFNLGDQSVIDTFPDEPLANDYSICTADICPVGALLSKDFHHKMRVWFLDETESVCPNCANGCNTKVGAARGQVYRFLPRRNDHVNDTWMCDAGRLGYRYVNENRLRAPRAGRGATAATVSWNDALQLAATELGELVRGGGASAVAAIVSPHLTNEELFTLRHLIAGGLRIAQRDVAVVEGTADDFLIKAEKAANARGARDLGVAAGPGETNLATIRAGIEAGTIRGLFVTGTDVWTVWGADAAAILGRLETLVIVAPNEHPMHALANVVLPGLTFAEKNGTFTNFTGRVQRIHRALDPGNQPSEGEIFLQLGRRLGMEVAPGLFDPRAIFAAITQNVPSYGTLQWDTLGNQGAATGKDRVAGNVVTVERKPRPRAMDTLGPLAILRGLVVTSSHFFRNLMGFIRGKPTIFTVQYPEELQQLAPAFRGMPVLVQMANGKERCVACGLCEWACPVDCITIYPAETEDEIERYPEVFDIDMSRCMFCGLCEEACPEEAIVMSQRVAIATTEWRGSVWHKRDLLTPATELQTRLTHLRRGYERAGASTTAVVRGKA